MLNRSDNVRRITPAEVAVHTFDLHGLVRVRVETRLPSKLEDLAHHMAEFQTPQTSDATTDVVILDYSEVAAGVAATGTAGRYRWSNCRLDVPTERISFDLSGTPIKVWCDRLVMPISLLLHLALLRRGYSFVHAAAVCFGGRNYLFPGFGGVGKTILVATVVFSGGTFFGDDMVIVGNGQVLSYPQDLSVYPYHVPILRLRDRRILRDFRRTALLNRLTELVGPGRTRFVRLVRRILDSFKVPYANVLPTRVFGEGCVAERGALDEIFFLARTTEESAKLSIAPADPAALADTCVSILFSEWQGFLGHLYAYSALFPFSVHRMYAETKRILQNLFESVPCYVMTIPMSWTHERYQDELLSFLEERGMGTTSGERASR